jgi:hypothetical protein
MCWLLLELVVFVECMVTFLLFGVADEEDEEEDKEDDPKDPEDPTTGVASC